MESNGEIFVVPFFGQRHMFPAMELCKNISSHKYDVTLIIPSNLSSSIPSSFTEQSTFVHVVETPVESSSPESKFEKEGGPRRGPLEAQNKQMGHGIKMFLSSRSKDKRPT
nr:UDP-glucosyl transferase 73B2-like [Tanacetum cinerariifolium]